MATLFDKLRQGLKRTRATLGAGVLGGLGRGHLDDDTAEELERALIEADIGVAAAERIVERLRADVGGGSVGEALRTEIHALLSRERDDAPPEQRHQDSPEIILVVGVNGVGKTTTIGKLAHRLQQDGKRVLVGSCDTFRAAAGDQLEVWVERAGAELVRQRDGSDPASVAFDAVVAGEARGVDTVILDTAGRLHNKANLMAELKKIRRVVSRRRPGAPHEILLVLDATTGQNGIRQAREFDAALGVSGLILTKLDGTARGGVVVAITAELGLPVRFIGVGEGIDDLVPFDAGVFIDALFARESDGPPVAAR
jgi:fused signal recognition particle receptor